MIYFTVIVQIKTPSGLVAPEEFEIALKAVLFSFRDATDHPRIEK